MPVQFDYTTTLYVETCCNCAVMFAMPTELRQRRKRQGGIFYCPNGHGQHYTETTEQQLKDELQETRGKLANREFELMTERNAHDATQKKLKRAAKRVANGVCPCCQRQFVNLARHMKGRHPDYGQGSKGGE